MDEIGQKALLNEYKGNLYEYLVALKLAQSSNIENSFLSTLSDDVRNMLRIQESYIRQNFPHLLSDLPLLAKAMSDKLLSLVNPQNINLIKLIGKVSAMSNQFAEADIIIESDQIIPISIKLSKNKAFVNTKSGGIKSFLIKYFPCELADQLQLSLNNFVDEKFHEMAFKLHEIAGLEYNMNFDEWISSGLPELPGKLSNEYKEVVHSLYYIVLSKLYDSLNAIKEYDSTIFYKGLMHLVGLGSESLVQATCFYQNSKNRYLLTDILIEKSDSILAEVQENKIGVYKVGLANFEIILPRRILQIRIKPMNKFTTVSFKVNCSVKKLP